MSLNQSRAPRSARVRKVPNLAQQTDKMAVYQACLSAFNSKTSPRNARILLARVAYLFATGETFATEEATELFFSVSKLFQHKDPALRQMMYLVISQLSQTASDVLMLTASIMKDIQASGYSVYKPNAIRALVRVIDPTLVQNMERLFKNCIADKHPSVSAAALVSAYHLAPSARDVVKRWANTAAEAITTQKVFTLGKVANPYASGSAYMYQYHAVGFLYLIKKDDRMALVKLIKGLVPKLRNSNAVVLLIRYVHSLIDHDRTLLTVLKDLLSHKSDMVNLESAKTILSLNNIPDNDALLAVNLLRSFLTAPRTVSKFAAIRILNDYAQKSPQNVATCNTELEGLIASPSRAISAYAITTLLKTGTLSSIDRLMSHIGKVTSEITDDFKVDVVNAIHTLAIKFPTKYGTMINFFAGTLRDDGSLALKTAVVNAMFEMIDFIPDCKRKALDTLCDYIEDCEFPSLTVRILHVLGDQGPSSETPSRYIRIVYNRLLLDNAIIRAAGVTALAKFTHVNDPHLQKSVRQLLERSLSDVSDEVRDRAAFALRVTSLNHTSISSRRYDLADLERKLVLYVTNDSAGYKVPFSIETVATAGVATVPPSLGVQSTLREHSAPQQQVQQLHQPQDLSIRVPEFEAYGPILKTTVQTALTEVETEYVVSAVKHLFASHVVIEYNVRNTFKGVVLENVSVECETDAEGLEEEFGVPATCIEADQEPGSVFVSFKRTGPEGSMEVGKIYNTLRFTVKEIDEASGIESDPYEDDYSLEALEITASDYLIPTYTGTEFGKFWDGLGNELGCESTQTYRFAHLTIAEAVLYLVTKTSLQPVDSTDEPTSESAHTLKLIGKTLHGEKVAARVKLVWSSARGVSAKITVRCEGVGLAEIIAGSAV